jgi:hypothetical protein
MLWGWQRWCVLCSAAVQSLKVGSPHVKMQLQGSVPLAHNLCVWEGSMGALRCQPALRKIANHHAADSKAVHSVHNAVMLCLLLGVQHWQRGQLLLLALQKPHSLLCEVANNDTCTCCGWICCCRCR